MTAEEFSLTHGHHCLTVSTDEALARAAEDVLPVWRTGDAHELRTRMLLSRTIAFAPHGDPARVAAAAGLSNLRPGAVNGCWLADAPSPSRSPRAAEVLLRAGLVHWAEPELARPRSQRTLPNDPRLPQQWHLINDGTLGLRAVAGNDLQVANAWNAGYTGSGRLIAIIDGAFDEHHPDLAPAYRTDLALNLLTHTMSPWAVSSAQKHGSFCAGLAAARGNNGIGITGVAYQAQILPIDLLDLSPSITDGHEATALSHHLTEIDVSSNSWGPNDEDLVTEGPGSQTLTALGNAVTTGRGGLGTILVWAAGNGWDYGDNLAFDGYASDYRVLAIGSLTIGGQRAFYSEGGPALFAMAPGGDADGSMISTLPFSSYSTISQWNAGTSFSAPCVAGVAALVIQANPLLTWRDVRHVLATTATQINATDAGWQTTVSGHPWHPGYGFGRINAGAAVTAAVSATLLPPSAAPLTGAWSGSLGIPDHVAAHGEAATITFAINAADTYRTESIECQVDLIHPRQGDLEMTLTAPSGRIAVVEQRPMDAHTATTFSWSACGFLDESPNGTWTLAVRDRTFGNTGRITGARLTIHGYRSDSGTSSGQSFTATGIGTSSSGSSAPTDPLASAAASTPTASSSGGSNGCGHGMLLGLFFAGAALARFRRKV